MSGRADGARGDDPPPVDASFAGSPHPDVTWIELDGKVVLFHERTGEVHVLNPTGSLVWQCLDGNADVATLADDLHEVTGAPRAVVERDLVSLLAQLVRQGLVTGG